MHDNPLKLYLRVGVLYTILYRLPAFCRFFTVVCHFPFVFYHE
jgi:hypothetical protein